MSCLGWKGKPTLTLFLSIRSCLDEHNGCFAPTMLALMQFEGLAKKQRPYSSLKNARKAKSSEDRVKKSNKRKSGSSRASVGTASTEADNDEPSTALAAEKIWLIDHLCESCGLAVL